jgi:HD-GYP domain-containing protein (c-di-GMP phosphodiesterase class II)
MIDWFPTPGAADAPPAGARAPARAPGMAVLRALARSIDDLDPTTAGHSERVAELAVRLAIELGWSGARATRLREAALVHDVGKIAVPRSVLLTQGGLTFEQYAQVKAHAAAGAGLVAAVMSPAETSWVRHHHERWDGRGYPDGIAGEDIPDGAAILCLADSWDAMRRRAWIGQPLSVAEALEECRREAGLQFAPWAVEALEAVVAAATPRALARMAPPTAPLRPAA